MANFQTAAWYSTHPPARATQSSGDTIDVQTIMQGLGIADEAAWRSLTNEVVEAHNTKNMIPHPKIPDGLLIQGPTNRQESALAVARIIQADSINSAPKWQHFPHPEWLTDALLEIAKRGFMNKRISPKIYKNTRNTQEKAKRGAALPPIPAISKPLYILNQILTQLLSQLLHKPRHLSQSLTFRLLL